MRIEEITFESGDLTLHGLVFRPASTERAPAILFNHGSEKGSSANARSSRIPPTFVENGYVYFHPFRRGHGASEGLYVRDILDAARARSLDEWSETLVEQMELHLIDQVAALNWLTSQPFVDSTRVVSIGVSFGGIQALLMAERGGVLAVVSCAGAAMTWKSSEHLRARLRMAAANAKVPVLLLQAANDFDLSPSFELAATMTAGGRVHRRIVYSAVGTTPMDGHLFMYEASPELWRGDVLGFIAQAAETPV